LFGDLKRPGGAANQQENLRSTGLTPALHRALTLINKFNEMNMNFLFLIRNSKIKGYPVNKAILEYCQLF